MAGGFADQQLAVEDRDHRARRGQKLRAGNAGPRGEADGQRQDRSAESLFISYSPTPWTGTLAPASQLKTARMLTPITESTMASPVLGASPSPQPEARRVEADHDHMDGYLCEAGFLDFLEPRRPPRRGRRRTRPPWCRAQAATQRSASAPPR
jgi:hypothetical protein